MGRPNRGKTQLHSEEISRYISAGLSRYAEHNDALALAAAMLPVFGMRIGEALSRRIRDIDRGRVWRLYIDRGLDGEQGPADPLKNENACRVLEIPSLFIPPLQRLIQGRESSDYLFGMSRTGKRKNNSRLYAAVLRLCKEAEVPRVCPHSMRGYYASAGVRSGALPHVVAANLGHSSFAVTARHYARPEAITEAHNARVLEVLDLSQGADVLSHLPPEQLIAKLPAATLARIAELLNSRTSTPPPQPVPDLPKPAKSRRKN
jgi:integrase